MIRDYTKQGGPFPGRGRAPEMLRDFYLPEDGVTKLERFLARGRGEFPTPCRTYRADNDNKLNTEEQAA